MKIGIDISMLVYKGSGVARYTYNLAENLLKYDKKNEYKFFYSSLRRPKEVEKKLDNLRKLGGKVYDYRFPPKILKLLWNKWHILPVEWLIGKVDYYHSSDFLRPPLLKGTKGITTIHDLTWKIFPEYHTQDIAEAHEKKMQKTIKYKDIIITDSKNTKTDILKYYPQIPEKNIHVIYLGVENMFQKIEDDNKIAKVLKKYNLKYPANYLIYVGAIEPRKNVDRAVEVFNELIKNNGYSNYKFLIVGRAGWKNEKVFNLVQKLKLEDKVIFVGYVPDKDLPYFYNASKCLMYLSDYEGFGLPPVEAVKCGIPTLMYENSSLKELFDDYEYAKKGEEVMTLKKILFNQIKPYLKNQFSYKKYVDYWIKKIYYA